MLARRHPINLAEAQARLAAVPLPTAIETIPIKDANHRTLAKEITAPYPFPNFRRSGYDGYAIRHADDHGYPKVFTVRGEVQAGANFDSILGKNETVRIMTGAHVPDSGDKVIMLEQTRAVPDHQDQIKIMTGSERVNITAAGSEFAQGQVLLTSGTELNPGGISMLAAFGYTEVAVYKQPKVAIITTGTELLKPTDAPQPGKIYNSNGPLITGLVQENGGVVTEVIQIPDDYNLLQENLIRLEATNDLVITDGGVSVGDFDYLATAARESDQLIFNKLSLRPGSVTTAFIQDGTLIMALSGNPGACFTGFYMFMEPILRRFVNQPSRLKKVTATLVKPYNKTNGYDKLLRGTYSLTDTGYQVQLHGSDRSGDLGNLQATNCLFMIPHSHKPIALNAEVDTWLLPFK